jgi:hypothetical protein
VRRWLIIQDRESYRYEKEKDLNFGGDYVGYIGTAIELCEIHWNSNRIM